MKKFLIIFITLTLTITISTVTMASTIDFFTPGFSVDLSRDVAASSQVNPKQILISYGFDEHFIFNLRYIDSNSAEYVLGARYAFRETLVGSVEYAKEANELTAGLRFRHLLNKKITFAGILNYKTSFDSTDNNFKHPDGLDFTVQNEFFIFKSYVLNTGLNFNEKSHITYFLFGGELYLGQNFKPYFDYKVDIDHSDNHSVIIGGNYSF